MVATFPARNWVCQEISTKVPKRHKNLGKGEKGLETARNSREGLELMG
jgi:hypothetical protein